MKKLESYAEDGKIEESAAMNSRKEKIEDQLSKLEAGEEDGLVILLPGGQKNVIPCEVCGAAVVGDQNNHFEGKQHIGYETIRTVCAIRTCFACNDGVS